ncbi:MAG: YeiH family protein [Bacteroidales bacterium]
MKKKDIVLKKVYLGLIFCCFLPFVSPAIGLLVGIVLSLAGFRVDKTLGEYTSLILKVSVVLLGFGMSLEQVIQASHNGFIETTISVVCVMLIGIMLGKLFRVESKVALLIATGTAICGGSAIAAIAPIVNSKNYQSSFALVVVFILNAIALFIFPVLGKYLHLSQEVFGNWAAIAIHDTSSVVGAGAAYGGKALQIATTVKLIRALWIIPLAFVLSFFYKVDACQKFKFPWFILFFVLALIISFYLPSMGDTYQHLNWLGRRGMVVALFLIGANISFKEIQKIGLRSFLLGILLWIIIAVGALIILL